LAVNKVIAILSTNAVNKAEIKILALQTFLWI